MSDPIEPSPAAPAGSLKIRVIGVGGAGCNMVAQLSRLKLNGLSCHLLNTDVKSLAVNAGAGVEAWQLGKTLLRGLSTGGDTRMGRAVAEADEDKIRSLCEGADMVFVVAGMGGGTGSGAAPVVARMARAANALVLGIAAMPFEFEGGRRKRQASLGLAWLQTEADAVICMRNDALLALAPESTSVAILFRAANERLASGIVGLWRMLVLPGIINVDFGTLKTALAARHAESFLAAAEAEGENRAFSVWEQIRSHPSIKLWRGLADAQAVVASFAGGEDLCRIELEWLMNQLQSEAPQARIVMGAAVDPAMQGRLHLTLLAVIHPQPYRESAPVETEAPAVPLRPEAAPDEALTDPSESLAPLKTKSSRFVPPPPEISPDKARAIYQKQAGGRSRRKQEAARQYLLPLEVVSKGRFEKSDPTIRDGQDLDIPTFVRRNVTLN